MLTNSAQITTFFADVRENYADSYQVVIEYDTRAFLFQLRIEFLDHQFIDQFPGQPSIIEGVLNHIFETFASLDRELFVEKLYSLISESTGFDDYVSCHSDEEIHNSKFCHDIYNFITVLVELFMEPDEEEQIAVAANFIETKFGLLYLN